MQGKMVILSISDNHDSGACILKDGTIVSAVNEERLRRKKLIGGFPYLSIEKVLSEADVEGDEIDLIVFAGSMTPISLLRLLEDFHNIMRMRSDKSFSFSYLLNLYLIYQVLASKLKFPELTERFLSTRVIKKKMKEFHVGAPIVCVDHHRAHAASAYYTSNSHSDALVITADAMGDGLSITVSIGRDGLVTRIFSQTAFSSISTYFSRLTEFLGLKPLWHEGKITGLAGYGKFDEKILTLAKSDFHFMKNKGGFNFKNHFLRERIDDRFHNELRRYPQEDVAHNFQKNFENEMIDFIKFWVRRTNIHNICLAGGAFANVSLNGMINRLAETEGIYIFPHMGDGGLALGAALEFLKPSPFYFKNIYLGAAYDDSHVRKLLAASDLNYSFLDEEALCGRIANILYEGGVVAHFNGKMEYGPRALGNRSILYRADDPSCQGWLNDRLRRTSYMPFAPVNLDYETDHLYPNIDKIRYTLRFMNVAVDCTKEMKERSPAAVHVDGTARPQILLKADNPRLYRILETYRGLKGTSVILNTSFNKHEEPIVCSPEDAIKSFLECELDYLVLNNFLVWQIKKE